MLPKHSSIARPPGSSSQPAGHAVALPDPWRLAKCAALARAAARTSSTGTTAAAASALVAALATRSIAFNSLPTEILILILVRVIGVKSLESFLACRALNRRSLLATWKVNAEPKARARKYKTFFSLVLRELHAGRCATCRKRVDRSSTRVGGVCSACHLRQIDVLRWTSSAKFYALPRRAIVGFDAPFAPKWNMILPKTVPDRIDQRILTACLGFPQWMVRQLTYSVLNNGHGNKAFATKTRKYELPVVERVMAAWTRRTEPPINLAVDWRALNDVERGGVGGANVAVGGGGGSGSGGVQCNVIVVIDSSEDEAEPEDDNSDGEFVLDPVEE
ncbi:hypothetical protein GGF32_007472 [Allomyces javanicus]|nr:hypothetical protein GGF32_007472 [Allomyces javanicus]